MMTFLEYAKKAIKPLPIGRWSGVSAVGDIEITGHTTGVDFSRGPWIKFKFKEAGKEFEVQGYRTWHKGDRIKFGPAGAMKECDDDQIAFTGALDVEGFKALVIAKFTFEQDEKLFAFRFVGKTN